MAAILATCAGSAAAEPTVKPRLILCAIGRTGWLDAVARHVDAFGHGFTLDRDYSIDEPDERMPKSFEASYDRAPPTWSDADRALVREHGSVAYVLSQPLERDTSIETCARALELAARLLRDGGLACKGDSAGVAHSRQRWLALADRLANAAGDERARILYRAWVRRPIDDDGVRYSVGMHLLGCPDVEFHGELDDLAATKFVDETAYAVLRGETCFPRAPCRRYEEDEFFFNPYGYVLISEPVEP